MLQKISDTCKHISSFFHHFLPHQQCTELRRIGQCADGSKLICLDQFILPKSIDTTTEKYTTIRALGRNERCIVYSFGSSDDSCFESHMATLTDCEIHIFDPTSREIKHPRWTYHSYGLTGHDPTVTTYWNWRTQKQANCTNCPMRTLQQIMFELNHTWIDILKIDVDGAEWRSLREIYTTMGSIPATQLQLELTGLDITDEDDSLAGKSAGVHTVWEHLIHDNYVIFHIEPNIGSCNYRGKSRSVSFEYALMKKEENKKR
jgi:Methyltransferase domain